MLQVEIDQKVMSNGVFDGMLSGVVLNTSMLKNPMNSSPTLPYAAFFGALMGAAGAGVSRWVIRPIFKDRSGYSASGDYQIKGLAYAAASGALGAAVNYGVEHLLKHSCNYSEEQAKWIAPAVVAGSAILARNMKTAVSGICGFITKHCSSRAVVAARDSKDLSTPMLAPV